MPFLFDNTTNEIRPTEITPPDDNIQLSPGGNIDVGDFRIKNCHQILISTTQASNYNAVAGDLVLCDVSTTGSFTVTLPASPNTDDRIGIKLQTASGSNTVTIGRNGNNIDGAAANLLLYVVNDHVELEYDGVDNWVVAVDNIQAHYGQMSSSTTNSLSTGVLTQVAFNINEKDVGAIVDTSGNEFDVRRAGYYMVYFSTIGTAVNSQCDLEVHFIRSSTTPTTVVRFNQNELNAEIISGWGAHIVELAAGESLEVWMRQNGGGAAETLDTSGAGRPQFSIMEIRR